MPRLDVAGRGVMFLSLSVSPFLCVRLSVAGIRRNSRDRECLKRVDGGSMMGRRGGGKAGSVKVYSVSIDSDKQ